MNPHLQSKSRDSLPCGFRFAIIVGGARGARMRPLPGNLVTSGMGLRLDLQGGMVDPELA